MRVLQLFVIVLCCMPCLGQLPSQDILSLLEFKKGIKHDSTGFILGSWNDESIDFNGCPSSWNGIMCNGANVAAVVLDNLQLSGEVDLGTLSNLGMLVKLSISNNSISGTLPTNLGDFKSLEYLDISNNLFFSSLPSDIGKLSSIKNLSLAGNNFSGSIPETISELSSLLSLDLSRNSLSGPIPSSLEKMGSLVYFNLSQNSFTRNIPKGFELMTQLDVLDLHGNMLDGEVNPELLLLTTASYVDLSGNSLVSSVKEQKNFFSGVSSSIKHLNLSHNQINGSLVGGDEAQSFGSLNVLDLSHNQLSGELPGFNFIYDLQVLKLGSNSFSGPIPINLLKGDSLVLTELDLSRNNLSGSVSMITSTTLHTLNLSSNMLSGELPPLTGSSAVVDLSRNRFEGTLTGILKWGDIEILDLSQNRLSGSIPEITAQFLRLNYLNLSNNILNGSLPKSITQFPKLEVLDLSFNQLEGPLLSSLLTSSTLNELHLENNKLSEVIDFAPLSNNSVLHVLDLSDNQFNGHIPDGFGSFTRLQVLNIAGNNISGLIPDSIGDISTLALLDFSRNRLTGPLPMNISATLQSFNASYNDLSGVVPENMRSFPRSSFYPGNSHLVFPNYGSGNSQSENHRKNRLRIIIIVFAVVASVSALCFLILLAVIIHSKRTSKAPMSVTTTKDVSRQSSTVRSSLSGKDSSAGKIGSAQSVRISGKGSVSERISTGEKVGAMTGFSPPKASHFSWSPESGDSYAVDNLSRLDVRSPDQLVGELYFLDDTITFTADELSKAPAEVLGRSSHGTSYKTTLENGQLLTVKWLREGVAKQKKEFGKEAKKFAKTRHPNVVGLRGYYWGPTQHEKLLLWDHISPGSLASFLYDKPRRKGPTLTWPQRLKIAVDVARGLNYLHFDRALPHGNLKASNVLLEGPDLNARVADYCLHRLMTQTGITEQMLDAGVLGYRAPELSSSQKPLPTFKSDVYAFGVILVELLTGKCAGDVVSGTDGGMDLTDWVRLRVAKGQGMDCLDVALATYVNLPEAEIGMKEALVVALKCIRPVSQRPGIKTIYGELSSII